MAEWRFREMERNEIRNDPVEGEFFTPEGLAEALVRESVQNSLDAKINDSVRVRFSYFGGSEPIGSPVWQRYLNGLIPHVEASIPGAIDQIPQDMAYVLVEDFGTRGLSGDPAQAGDLIDGQGKNDFYYFWRNVGRSVKSATDRGRWGLGKTVFPASSRVNSFFGFSICADSLRPTLMGQAVLKTHAIGPTLFCPHGYFANFEADGFAMPDSSPLGISRFKEDFHLSRSNEPGLSAVIPLPRAEGLEHDDVVRFAILHFFYPILAGDLVLEFRWNGQSTHLDRQSLLLAARQIDWTPAGLTRGGIEATLDLAAWAIDLPESKFSSLRIAGERGVPKWAPDLFNPAMLPDLQTRFEQNERIAIRIPISLELRPSHKLTSFFDVFLERDITLENGEDHYIRQGLTVSGIHMLGKRKARGFVIIKDLGLSTLLGDTENPSHTLWQDRSGHLEEGYIQGPSRLRFVKKSLPSIVDFLSRPPSGLDERLLEDLFSIDLPPDEVPPVRRPRGDQPKPGDRPQTPPSGIPPPAPQPFQIQQMNGGFRVKGNPDVARGRSSFSVEVAYEVRKGNPFKKYLPFDFKLDEAPIRVEAERVSISKIDNNKLMLTAESTDFEVEVTGFDERRDLRVRVIPTGGPDDSPL